MPENSDRLTHLDDAGRAHIVDVSEKAVTAREATATSCVRMQGATLNAIVAVIPPRAMYWRWRVSPAFRPLKSAPS